MFDSDEITKLVVIITDGHEIFAYRGELVENNLVNVTSGATKVRSDLEIGSLLIHV